jgi:hypothetical protein
MFVSPEEGSMASRTNGVPMNFKSMPQGDVPHGRHGKHSDIVTKLLSDLAQIPEGTALKVPLAQLADGKERVRSALNRVTRKSGRTVATASDDTFLYVWNEKPNRDRSRSNVTTQRGKEAALFK